VQKAVRLMLHVRPALPADVPVIIEFIDEAAGWLAAKGTDQWAKPWPNQPERDSRVERGVRDRCTWLVEDGSSPVATISCRPVGNRDLWTEPELAKPAVYVSRLIVSRSHSGQDLGTELLDWAGLWAARQYGAHWIRIDVWTTNTALHNYYEKRGFEFIRRCESVDYPSAALFQKPTSRIGAADVTRLHDRPMLRQPGSQVEDPDGSDSSQPRAARGRCGS
jgi:GNAT superfamily N-acetyltransferase